MTVAVHNQDTLGESPFWDWRTGHLYWVDLRKPALHRLDPVSGAYTSWAMPSFIGCVVGRRTGGLLVGLADGLHAFSPETGTLSLLLPLEAEIAEHRLNDAKCDTGGALWIGTMWDFGRQRTGSLYRIAPSLKVKVIRSGVSVPNAVSFSPDGAALYFTDSRVGSLKKGILNETRDDVVRWETILPADRLAGSPDGATVDEEGYVWHARYRGGAIVRLAPDGRIDSTIPLPVSQPTSCAFGGPELKTLYITTASQGLSPEQLEVEPLAGALLAFDMDIAGRLEPLFGG